MQEQFVGWVQRRRSGTQRWLHKPAGQSLSGCAGAPPDLRFPLHPTYDSTTRFCRVALPLHPTYDKVLSGCAAAPPDLRLRPENIPPVKPWCCSGQLTNAHPVVRTIVMLICRRSIPDRVRHISFHRGIKGRSPRRGPRDENFPVVLQWSQTAIYCCVGEGCPKNSTRVPYSQPGRENSSSIVRPNRSIKYWRIISMECR